MKRKKERKKDYYTIVYCGIKNLNYSLKFHRFYRIFAYNGEKKKIPYALGVCLWPILILVSRGKNSILTRNRTHERSDPVDVPLQRPLLRDELSNSFRNMNRCCLFRVQFINPFRGALSASELTFE